MKRLAPSARSRSAAWSTPLVCAVVLVCGQAEAQSAAALADDAENAYVDLKYDACVSKANASIKKMAETGARVRAYKYRGLCQAALSDVDAARESFEAMLAIDINAKLPEGLSPRFTSSYFEAKGRWIGREAITLAIAEESIDDDVRTLTLTLKDESELVRYIAWRDIGEKVFEKVRAAEKVEIEVPLEDAVDVVALDRGGAPIRVTVLSTMAAPDDEETMAPSPFEAKPAPKPAEAEGELPVPLLIGGGVVGAVVVVGAAAAVAATVFFLNQQSVDAVPSVTFSEDVIAEGN